MTTIKNTTRAPLSVRLPGGKTLHLGPGKSGQVSPKALDHPAFKALVDAGQIEVLREDRKLEGGSGGGGKGPGTGRGFQAPGGVRHTGDRG